MSIQVELDEISMDQPEVWMKLVEEKLSCALREAGRDMASEAFQRIITSKAPTKTENSLPNPRGIITDPYPKSSPILMNGPS
ncbi:MAG: hypothetical protein ABIM74_07770 [candidate division WOR-3 bacterium]